MARRVAVRGADFCSGAGDSEEGKDVLVGAACSASLSTDCSRLDGEVPGGEEGDSGLHPSSESTPPVSRATAREEVQRRTREFALADGSHVEGNDVLCLRWDGMGEEAGWAGLVG